MLIIENFDYESFALLSLQLLITETHYIRTG